MYYAIPQEGQIKKGTQIDQMHEYLRPELLKAQVDMDDIFRLTL